VSPIGSPEAAAPRRPGVRHQATGTTSARRFAVHSDDATPGLSLWETRYWPTSGSTNSIPTRPPTM